MVDTTVRDRIAPLRAPASFTGAVGGASKAPLLLRVTAFALFFFPSSMVIKPLGAAGTVPIILACVVFVVWLLSWIWGIHDPIPRRHPGRLAIGVFLITFLIPYLALYAGWTGGSTASTLASADRILIQTVASLGLILFIGDALENREQIMSLTTRVNDLLASIAAGLREGWDADQALEWYDTSTEIIQLAPQVQAEIETGRESTRFNPRDNLQGITVDWTGYTAAVEAVRRTQWQVSGIARTLVDAADEGESLPAPSQRFLEAYAEALDHVGSAVNHFGIDDEEERRSVHGELAAAVSILDRLGHEVRETRLDDPRAWPAYGALLLDARRLARELELHSDEAVVPTDSGPIRIPKDGLRRRIQGV